VDNIIEEKKVQMRATWIIHELRLPQKRGAGYEAVVFHREWPATKQKRWYRLAWKVKNADIKLMWVHII